MQLGMLGLGRMGANMVRRLVAHGHECVGSIDRQMPWLSWPRKMALWGLLR